MKYPRFIMESDRCILKLYNEETDKDEEMCAISRRLALSLLRDLARIAGELED
jgi:hypothetical protein